MSSLHEKSGGKSVHVDSITLYYMYSLYRLVAGLAGCV